MNRYAIALGKFPTFADVYDVVFGYREPWEYQTGKRYNSNQWRFTFKSFKEASIRFLHSEPQYFQHYTQGEFVTLREPTYLEYGGMVAVRCPDHENRNGRIYPGDLLDRFQEQATAAQQWAIENNRPVIMETQTIPRGGPLRGMTHMAAAIDDHSWYTPPLGSTLQYPSSITMRLKKRESNTNITGGVLGIVNPVKQEMEISPPQFFDISWVAEKNKTSDSGKLVEILDYPDNGLIKKD